MKSNMTLKEAAKFIKENNNFILSAHETPDGDAVGGEIAFYLALEKIEKNIRIINSDPFPIKFNYLNKSKVIETIQEKEDYPDNLSDTILIILDTNDIHNIGSVSRLLLPHVRDVLIIDHHVKDFDKEHKALIDDDSSSTCEIIFELIEELNIEIDVKIAEALFTGIVYDTGSFVYPKTSAKTFETAYKLVKTGVNPNYIFSKMYESNSIESLILQSRVMSTLELIMDQRVAMLTMLKEMIIDCKASYEDADQIINIPLRSEKVRISIFFKENLMGILRCSLRSKGGVNVAEIARGFGGGGHKTAAGFKCREPLEIIREKVLEQLSIYFT